MYGEKMDDRHYWAFDEAEPVSGHERGEPQDRNGFEWELHSAGYWDDHARRSHGRPGKEVAEAETLTMAFGPVG